MENQTKTPEEVVPEKTTPREPLTRITFIRDDRGRPVGCIAYRVLPEGRFEYEFSTHNPKDAFDRQMARKVAEGRLDKHPMVVTFDPSNAPKLPELLRQACIDLVSGTSEIKPEKRTISGRLLRALSARLNEEIKVASHD